MMVLEQVKRSLNALVINAIDSRVIPLPIAENPHQENFNTLIVLGKNLGPNSSSKNIRNNYWHLSLESVFNVLAAASLYKPGINVIFSTGKTSGRDIISEAAAMKNLFLKIKEERREKIDENDILLEESSFDTASNAREVGKIEKTDGRDWGHVGLITTSSHLPNALRLFVNNRVAVNKGIISETLVAEISVGYKKLIEKYHGTERFAKEERKEILRSILLLIDPRGELQRFKNFLSSRNHEHILYRYR